MNPAEKTLIRNLAKRYMDIATEGIQDIRRNLWRNHNSFEFSHPPIYVRAFAWREMPESLTESADPLCKAMETFFKQEIFRSKFDDDYIVQPWYTLHAVKKCHGWGVEYKRHFAGELDTLESYKVDYFLKKLEDMDKLRAPFHSVDEEQTAILVEKTNSLIGDIMPIDISRGPAYWCFSADISTDLGHLRGIENIMMDMYENPQQL
ncbi:MAG: hypothetical protein WC637_23315, partial [Victivallales bacterium]